MCSQMTLTNNISIGKAPVWAKVTIKTGIVCTQNVTILYPIHIFAHNYNFTVLFCFLILYIIVRTEQMSRSLVQNREGRPWCSTHPLRYLLGSPRHALEVHTVDTEEACRRSRADYRRSRLFILHVDACSQSHGNDVLPMLVEMWHR